MNTSTLHFIDCTLSTYRNELLFNPSNKMPAREVNDALSKLLELPEVCGKVRDTLTTHLNDRRGYARVLSKPAPTVAEVIASMEFALGAAYAAAMKKRGEQK